MKFKKLSEPVYTSETCYDLFDSGYISPRKMLADDDDIARVEEAVNTVGNF